MAFRKKISFKRVCTSLAIIALLITIVVSDLNIMDENDGTKNIQIYSGITKTVFSLLVKKQDERYKVKILIISPCKWDEENKKYVLSEEGS